MELGAGTSHILAGIESHDQQLFALDHNYKLLLHGHRNVSPTVANFDGHLPFRGKTFDAIILSFVIHLSADKEALIREVSRVLKPSGLVFILTCSEGDISRRTLNRFLPSLKAKDWERYGGIASLKKTLIDQQIEPLLIELIQLGSVKFDADYSSSLRNRCWSSLYLLPKSELDQGLAELDAYIAQALALRGSRSIPWIRTAIIGRRT